MGQRRLLPLFPHRSLKLLTTHLVLLDGAAGEGAGAGARAAL